MTVRPSFSRPKLLLGALSLLCWLPPSLNAIQPPDATDNPDTTQQATELKGVSAAELTAFTDSLAAKGLWLTELSTRMSRGNQVFDATAAEGGPVTRDVREDQTKNYTIWLQSTINWKYFTTIASQ